MSMQQYTALLLSNCPKNSPARKALAQCSRLSWLEKISIYMDLICTNFVRKKLPKSRAAEVEKVRVNLDHLRCQLIYSGTLPNTGRLWIGRIPFGCLSHHLGGEGGALTREKLGAKCFDISDNVKLLVNHEPHAPYGCVFSDNLDVWQDDYALWFQFEPQGPIEPAHSGLSPCMTVLDMETETLNSGDNIQVVLKAKLHEISIVSEGVPAYPQSRLVC